MEELLVLILQFFFEVIFQVLLEWPWDEILKSRKNGSNSESHLGLWIVLSFFAGAFVGLASLIALPNTLLHSGTARMANLVVAPTISALVPLLLSRSSKRRGGNRPSPKTRAICAACFTFALAIIRFTYAGRPPS